MAALLLLGLLLVVGLATLAARSRRYQLAKFTALSVVAEQLARAGLEDARAKLNKDLDFPPSEAIWDQTTFTYSEDLEPGSFRVTVDTTHRGAPYHVVVVTSTGLVGPREQPQARRSLRLEWDAAPFERSGSGLENASAGRILRFQDLGG